MRILNLRQGSPEWLEHRRTKFNASDAPAMLGQSPHCTRTELLHRMFTGIAPEVDAATQRRFDAGHQVEALLRKVAEQIVGEPLHPFVAVADFDERYSASLDGCTFVGDETAECKLLNARLRAAFADMETVAPEHRERSAAKCLPIDYRIQMEQQARVAKAVRVLFLAGELRDDGTLGDVFSCWYYPDDGLWSEIVAGWAQFEADLCAYVPPAAAAAPAVATPVESLPAVQVRMDGALTIHSNLPAFGAALRAFIERIPAQPTSDQEFADCEAACKSLKKAEEALEAEEGRALAGMADVEQMRRMVADLAALARTTRLQREKLVKARKDQLRLEQVQRGRAALAKHLQALNQRLGAGYMPDVPADFAGVISGKKTMASIADAIDTELARAKIAANDVADRIQINMQALVAAGDKASFPDAATLVLKAPEDCKAIIAGRVAEQERKLEEQRARIRQEEEARAAAKVRQEQEAQQAEQRRQQAAAEEAERLANRPALLERAREIVGDIEAAEVLGDAITAQPGATVHPMPTRAPAAQAVPPTLKLGDLQKYLAPMSITAEGLVALGFPVAATERGAKLYHDADLPRILGAAIGHLAKVRDQLVRAA